MDSDHFEYIRRARAVEENSPHPTHKVGACLRFSDDNSFTLLSHNYWPDKLANTIGRDEKLGNASATIHAEIASLIEAPASTDLAKLYVTDLPCPNCAKTLVEAGISNVYIDSHTYETPLGQKMKPFFEQVSLLIFERAGIGVYEIDLPSQSLLTLLKSRPRKNDLVFSGAHKRNISDISQSLFRKQINALGQRYDNNDPNLPYAACIASDNAGNNVFMAAKTHNTSALTQGDSQHINKAQNKYEPALQPFNRLLAQCAYYDVKIKDGYLYTNQTPTSRELVNMIGYGLTSIMIGDPDQCRDEYGLAALKQLREHNIMKITTKFL